MNSASTGVVVTAVTLRAQDLLVRYDIGDDDLARIRAYGEHLTPRLDEFVVQFYDWLAQQPEFEEFFSSREKLEQVQAQQHRYWKDFLLAKVDDAYIGRREMVGETHARIGLSLDSYLAAMNLSLKLLMESLHDGSEPADVYAQTVRSVTKLLHLDTSVVVNAFATRTKAIITEQTETLLQMSTPVTEIWNGILMLPLVGIIDSVRARDVMNAMLMMIAKAQARAIILDIGGVAVVDTAVANHLIKITRATKLMGCECTISGISPAIAQTMVELGIEVGDINTTATLSDALAYAFQKTGVEIRQVG